MPMRLPSLPENETDAAIYFTRNFESLWRVAEELPHSIALYEEATAASRANDFNRKTCAWALIGARDAVMHIYSFSQLMQEIDGHLAKAPTIGDLTDRQIRKQARKLFEETFPKIALARLDAAHPKELAKNKLDRERHSAPSSSIPGILSGDTDIQIMVTGSVFDGAYTATINGNAVSVPINAKAAETLFQVCELLTQAFQPIVEYTEAERRRRYQQTPETPDRD